jgi:5-methyltetrahydropteroyltriglutamate--homocysteine methyltransferase
MHVGSLLRPPELIRARDDAAAGKITPGELRAVEDAAIAAVVWRQQEVGLAAVTDGELRRESWHMDFIYQLGGIARVQDETIRVAFTGHLEVEVDVDTSVSPPRVRNAGVIRTARKLFDGTVFPPSTFPPG